MRKPWRVLLPRLLGLLSNRTQDHSPGMIPTVIGWTLPDQPLIKKMPTGLPTAQSFGGIFVIEAPSSQTTLACQVDVTLASTSSEGETPVPPFAGSAHKTEKCFT